MTRDPLAPGGREAFQRGCTCPVLDNGHGDVELARDRGGWCMFGGCPLHAPGGPEAEHAAVPARPGSQPIA